MILHHDPLRRSATCPAPLSRKKLKQLMRHNRTLTAKGMWEQFARMSPSMKRELLEAERERERKVEQPFEEKVNEAILEEVQEGKARAAQTGIFKRLSATFDNIRNRVERENRKGK
jgi:hypothetical protein